jgi:hypothetical protein
MTETNDSKPAGNVWVWVEGSTPTPMGGCLSQESLVMIDETTSAKQLLNETPKRNNDPVFWYRMSCLLSKVAA